MKLRGHPKYCKSLVELKRFVTAALPESMDGAPSLDDGSEIGSGHGSKGKRCWLNSNTDLKEMYKQHQGKKEILVWCYSENPEPKKTASASI